MKLSKTKRKLIKSLRRQHKKFRRYLKRCLKRTTKKFYKTKRKLIRLARKNNKKLRKYLKRTTKVSIYSSGLIILIIVCASFGVAFAQQRLFSNPINTTAKTSAKPANLGPAQTDSSFSIYPSWAQNFANYSSSTLSSKDWEVYQGPAQNSNNEAQYYTNNPANLRVANGALTLEATRQAEPQNYQYASARVDTAGKRAFLYGRIDITAKLPDSVGTWPAAWLLPDNSKYEDLSPNSDSNRYMNGGEIDMIEEVGSSQNLEYGVLHTLSDDLGNPNGVGSYNTQTVPDNNINYNLYSLLWTPTSMTFEVNQQPFYTYTKSAGADYTTWPFDQPFYLILNLALGGSWGGLDTAQYPPNGIDNSSLPASMDIQSIYYYPYVGSPTAK